jgi:hypothetical protein
VLVSGVEIGDEGVEAAFGDVGEVRLWALIEVAR